MKAWFLEDICKTTDKSCFSLVFAETEVEAKSKKILKGRIYQTYMDIDDVYIKTERATMLDGWENRSEKDICLKLVKDYGWWFVIGGKQYDEYNINEFRKYFDLKKIGGKNEV